MKKLLPMLALFSATAFGDSAGYEGRCLENPGFEGDYLVSISNGLSVAYRSIKNDAYFFLVSAVGAGQECGSKSGNKIVASLSLPEASKGAFYAVNFDCSNGSSAKTGDPIIGLFRGSGMELSIAAWRVEPLKRKFLKIENVTCKTFS